MVDRDTTKRMFTQMINMIEQHDTMTISCCDPLMELLKDVRELLKEQEAVKPYIDIDEAKCPICKVKLTRQELLGDDVLFEDLSEEQA